MKTPFTNAVFAAFYIVLIVNLMNVFRILDVPENNILIPMTMLCLLVLSVSIMGFLFGYEPLRLYLENRKDEVMPFFLKTVGYFACIATLFVISLLCTAYW